MSRSNATAKIREIAESSSDPKKAILMGLGREMAKEVKVLHAQVLVATYIQPSKTKGGILLADQTLQEDRFQGTIGLVIGLGPLAFKDDNIARFGGVAPALLDWVMFRPADGMEMFINSVPCRIFEDRDIKMLVQNPMLFW